MAKTIHCQAQVAEGVNCNVPLKWDFLMEKWLHLKQDAFTTHDPVVPEGTKPPLNLIEELMEKNVAKLNAARAKYGPLVSNLDDLEFAGLFQVVQEERNTRIAVLIATNPLVRAHALEMVKQEAETHRS